MNALTVEFNSNYSLISSVQKVSDQENRIFYGIEAQYPEKVIRYDDIAEDIEKVSLLIKLLNEGFVDEIQFEYILDDFVLSLYLL